MSILSSKYVVIVGAVTALTGCSGAPPTNNNLPTPTAFVSTSASPAISAATMLTKKAQVQSLVMKMESNSLAKIQSLLPDLKVLKTIPNDSAENLMKMGPETWYYSPELNQIIAVCDATQAPMHIFEGPAPTAAEVESAKMMMKEMGSMMSGDHTMMTEQIAAPVYQNYTPELYASFIGKKSFVLFFHAGWCPTCKRMDQEINAALTSFPQGTVILKTDYDTEIALKKTFGIQVQSSIVVLNAKGEVILKAIDPGIAKMKESITQSL